MSGPVHIGVLYPGPRPDDPYDEYEAFATGLPVPVVAHIAFTRMESLARSHSREVIVETGHLDRLVEALGTIREHPLRSVVFACTCASFISGPAESLKQAEDLARAAGVPASTTSQAFVAAVQAMGLKRVSVLATYPPAVARLFVDLLEDVGTRVVSMKSLQLPSGGESNRLSAEDLMEDVIALDHPAAEAVLIPDTAVRSLEIIEPLEAKLDKPVLTANQVTGWRAIRLAGLECLQPRYGALMARAYA